MDLLTRRSLVSAVVRRQSERRYHDFIANTGGSAQQLPGLCEGGGDGAVSAIRGCALPALRLPAPVRVAR